MAYSRRYKKKAMTVINDNKVLFASTILLGSALTVWGMMPKTVTTQIAGLNPKKQTKSGE